MIVLLHEVDARADTYLDATLEPPVMHAIWLVVQLEEPRERERPA